jgi:hypothetical protein
MYCRTAIGAVTAPADPIAPVAAGKTKLVIDSHGRCVVSVRFDPATGGTAIAGDTAVTGGTVLVLISFLFEVHKYKKLILKTNTNNNEVVRTRQHVAAFGVQML